MFNLLLMNVTADCRRVHKENAIEETVANLSNVQLKENTNIVDPTFIIQHLPNPKNKHFNYIYCEYLHRFYFVEKVTYCKGGIWEIECHVDVLMTYQSYILSHNFLVVRSEKKFFKLDKKKNGIFFDTEYPIRSDATIYPVDIGNVGSGMAYYLTVNGGVQ